MDNLERIEVRHYGSSGPEVVVLHGGPGAPGSAAGLARSLAKHFHVLEPLQRRSGRVPLNVSRHVEDLSAVILQPATLIGWSWGAMLGLSFTARYPQDVAALVLIGCGTYDENSRAILRRTLDERLGENGLHAAAELESRLTSELDVVERDLILGKLGALHMNAESYDIDSTPDPADNLPVDEAGHVETWNDVLRLQRDGIEPQTFRAVTTRVLMIHGSEDPHPGGLTRELLRRYIPQLEYIELDRCGHEPWRERHARDRFVALVQEWLG